MITRFATVLVVTGAILGVAVPPAEADAPQRRDDGALALPSTLPPAVVLGTEAESTAGRPRPDFHLTCSGLFCDQHAVEPPALRNPNAPQSLGGTLRVGTPQGFVSFGAVATRDYKLPLFMSTIIGGDEMPTPPVSSLSDLSRGDITWQFTAAVKMPLFTSRGGLTVSGLGDVFLPVGSEIPGGPHNPVLSSRAIRFGISVGF